VKYAQITGRDYVSGAMENTTATLHAENAQQDARELVDGNAWESTIAHELFHQWFGDLVTTESWSNITLNESFANYSETLWSEYKYGKDAGDEQNYTDMMGYLRSNSEKKDLVRYYYSDKEDVFDAVSYNKGGRILHMLRHYVGDSAFFRALNLYLTTYKYKSAEASQLRLAFEDVTGLDLHWFWNQWYYGSGHPVLNIDYKYDDAAGLATVIVQQTQKDSRIFTLPIAIDVYESGKKTRHQLWLEHQADTFSFSYKKRPDLINVDAEKILLAVKKDNKTLQNYIYQYSHAGSYVDRREAIEFASKNQTDAAALAFLKEALKDRYFKLREMAVSGLDMDNETVKNAVEQQVFALASKDPSAPVRAAALEKLTKYDKDDYNSLFEKSLHDSSYSVAGVALEALAARDQEKAYEFAKTAAGQPAKGKLLEAIAATMIRSKDPAAFDIIASSYGKMPVSQSKFELTPAFCGLLAQVEDTDKLKNGVDMIVAFRKAIPEQYGITPYINNMLKSVISKKESAKALASDKTALQAQIDYIKEQIGEGRQSF
ncbi:MAG TPA: M1 family aminopeptidase, partial [Chitinophagaceae bacterium]|nr:M1 family aminopeptidase [Chitinophagaceae bacterium]